MQKFGAYKQLKEGVEGYFTDLAAAVSDCLLCLQIAENYRGNMVEVGAWHGVSASMWSLHLRENETLKIVDLEVRSELVAFVEKMKSASSGTIELVKGSSYGVIDDRFIQEARQQVRLSHIDGDHSAWGVRVDLEKVARTMSVNGLIIVDDFLNDRFPQVTEETFKFLRQNDSKFQLVACGANKAFIVTTKRYPVYSAYLRDRLVADLAERRVSGRILDAETAGRYVISIRPG